MPTVHYMKRKYVKKYGWKWCVKIRDTMRHRGVTPMRGHMSTSIANSNKEVDQSTAADVTPLPVQVDDDNQGVDITIASETNGQPPSEIIPRINDRILSSNKKPTTSPAPAPCLKRKSNDLIWVRVGITNHPAYELQYYNDGKTNETGVDTNTAASKSITWVEWASNGKREPINKDQIVKEGLQARKRQRPNYFS